MVLEKIRTPIVALGALLVVLFLFPRLLDLFLYYVAVVIRGIGMDWVADLITGSITAGYVQGVRLFLAGLFIILAIRAAMALREEEEEEGL